MKAPHVFAQKVIPQEMFPSCIGFVPGGNVDLRPDVLRINLNKENVTNAISGLWKGFFS